jgi:hypothetical protein
MQTPDAVGTGRNSNCGFSPIPGNKGAQESCAVSGIAWYPDVLGRDGNLTDREPKPYWQSGWLKQHDRLMEAMASAILSIRPSVAGDH